MNEYQKERINRLMRNEWESYTSHMLASVNPIASEKDNKRHEIRAYEALAWLNGARETLLILGYSVRYEDQSCPQIV